MWFCMWLLFNDHESVSDLSKGFYFLPCLTFWWWTKWHLSHSLQLMCPSSHTPLCRRYTTGKQMSFSLFMWRYHTLFPQFVQTLCLMFWQLLAWEKLSDSMELFFIIIFVSFLPHYSLWKPFTANETVLGIPIWMVFFCLLDSVVSFHFQSFAVCMEWDSCCKFLDAPHRKNGCFLQFKSS